MNESSSKLRKGVALNYILLIVNTLSGILLTPILLSSLGDVEYGIYQLMISISGYLTILNLGTGSAMNRFVSMYRIQKDYTKEKKYIFSNFLIDFLLSIIIFLVGYFVLINISSFFPSILDSHYKIDLAQKLVFFSVLNIMFSLFSNSLEGLLNAYGHIDYSRKFSLFRLILRTAIIIFLLFLGFGSIVIVIVDCVITILYIIFLSFLCFSKFKIRLKIGLADNYILSQSVVFSLACLLSSLSGQLNNNVDKTILGVMSTEYFITVYSIATTFYVMFTSLGAGLNNVFLNKMTSIIYSEEDFSVVTDYNIKIGRFQNFIVGLCYFGFVLFGYDFIQLWLGKEYLIVYAFSIILITPNFLVCIGGVPEAILDAMNKKMFKSIAVLVIGVLNIFITIALVSKIGAIGAPIGTSLSLFVGYVVIMNVYYTKSIGLDMIRTYKEVLKGFLPCQLIVTICFYFIRVLLANYVDGYLLFITEGLLFVFVYFVVMFNFALNDNEKTMFKSYLKKEKKND